MSSFDKSGRAPTRHEAANARGKAMSQRVVIQPQVTEIFARRASPVRILVAAASAHEKAGD